MAFSITAEKMDALLALNELALNESETERLNGIFERMSAAESVMNEINTDGVDVMVHVMPMENVFREDVHVQHFSRESLLDGSPEHTEDSWQVPRLVK